MASNAAANAAINWDEEEAEEENKSQNTSSSSSSSTTSSSASVSSSSSSSPSSSSVSASPSPASTPAGMGVMQTTEAPQIIEHLNKTIDFTPMDVKWVPVSPRFVTLGQYARGTGAVVVHEMTPSEVKVINTIERPAGVKCGTFGASFLEDRHMAVGDYGGNVSILSLETGKTVWTVNGAHKQMINCIDGIGGLNIGYGSPEIVTGGRDGIVRVWDPRISDPVVSLEPGEGIAGRDCWTVGFGNSYSDEERCLVAGFDNGDVKIFDLRMNAVRWEVNVGNGVVCAEFDRKDIEMNKMVVTTLESKFKVFDMRTQHPTTGFANKTERAHKATVWLARHLPQNRDVWMTSGGNGGLNIYRYHYPANRVERDPEGRPMGVMGKIELVNARILSSQPIVGFDWSPDKEGLAAAVCLDQTLRVFIVTKLGRL